MIDKDKAKAAIDDAFNEGVKNLFRVLDAAIIARTDHDGDDKFLIGLGALVRTRDRANAIVDSFPQQW